MISSSLGPCAICTTPSDGIHFGCATCKACAAFYRRSILEKKIYKCRRQNSCPIESAERNMCRSCRMRKCASVMNYPLTRRKMTRKSSESSSTSSDVAIRPDEQLPSPSSSSQFGERIIPEGCCLLQHIDREYQDLEKIRTIIHTKHMFQNQRPPQAVSFKDAYAIQMREIGMITVWLNNSCPRYQRMLPQEKEHIFKNFFLPFTFLEYGFRCATTGQSDRIPLPSGDYIDCHRPDIFYDKPDGTELMTKEDNIRVFGSSFDVYMRNLIIPMVEIQIDRIEFIALVSITLWGYDQRPETTDDQQIAKGVKEHIIKELIYYYEKDLQVLKKSEYASRVAEVLLLLPALQRAVNRFREDMGVNYIFGSYDVDPVYYSITGSR